MLKLLAIKFFQSHRNTSLKFSPYFNIIYGEPCSGKTAIIRSFVKLKDNRPAGNRFNSWFSKGQPTEVSVVTSEDIRIDFSKSKKVEYRITGHDSPFNPGNNVPKEVGEILNFGEMNIQRQLDKTFVITESPGKIAARLNKIIQMENADAWVSAIAKKIKGIVREEKYIRANRIITREQLKELPDLKLVKSMIDDVKDLSTKADAEAEKIKTLKAARRRVREFEKQLKELPVEEIKAKYERLRRKEKAIQRLEEKLLMLKSYRRLLRKEKSLKAEEKELVQKLDSAYKKITRCPTCKQKIDSKQKKIILAER